MPLIKKKTLIGLCCAATLLDLDESTIRKGLCGTEGLTLVPKGRRISAILEEVVELRAKWIDDAIAKQARTLKPTKTEKRLKLVA
ncbi:MAG: hypothetical protein LUM44_10005 [Pyrinomonadaceae bacterium]|nr:hypothetical protein [Pyrinomonadaceae bacterium]